MSGGGRTEVRGGALGAGGALKSGGVRTEVESEIRRLIQITQFLYKQKQNNTFSKNQQLGYFTNRSVLALLELTSFWKNGKIIDSKIETHELGARAIFRLF